MMGWDRFGGNHDFTALPWFALFPQQSEMGDPVDMWFCLCLPWSSWGAKGCIPGGWPFCYIAYVGVYCVYVGLYVVKKSHLAKKLK